MHGEHINDNDQASLAKVLTVAVAKHPWVMVMKFVDCLPYGTELVS